MFLILTDLFFFNSKPKPQMASEKTKLAHIKILNYFQVVMMFALKLIKSTYYKINKNP